MATFAENRLLTEVGPRTQMRNLLRRYWQPIGAVAELDDEPTKRVRLLGEDLLFDKDLSGTYGLIDRHCSHRRADMSYGIVNATAGSTMKKAPASRNPARMWRIPAPI